MNEINIYAQNTLKVCTYTENGNIYPQGWFHLIDGTTNGNLMMNIPDIHSHLHTMLELDEGIETGNTYHMSTFITNKLYSLTPNAHQIVLNNSTWNGTDTTATLGGAAGDGLEFIVLSNSVITVTSNKNTTFS